MNKRTGAGDGDNQRREPLYYKAVAGVLLVALVLLFTPSVSRIVGEKYGSGIPRRPVTITGHSMQAEELGPKHVFNVQHKQTVSHAHRDISSSGDAVMAAFRDNPCMTMPVPELLAAIIGGEEKSSIWGEVALLLRAEEAAPYLEHKLRHGSPWEQYVLARSLRWTHPERHRRTLLTLACDDDAHPQARIGACYAVSCLPLGESAVSALLAMAQNAKSPVLSRTALIALMASDLSSVMDDLETVLMHEDALTRIYAARLLLEHARDIAPDLMVSLASDDDYLVRQEAYCVLGLFDDSRCKTLLEAAAQQEKNTAAARAARLALRARHSRSLADASAQAHVWLDAEDDIERWQGAQYALRRNKAAGVSALALLSREPTLLGEMSFARLLVLLLAEAGGISSLPPHAQANAGAVGNKHFFEIHRGMARYVAALHNAQPDTLKISQSSVDVLAKWVVCEDFAFMPVNHAYNPLTERGFVGRRGFGGSARLYVERLLNRLDTLYDGGNFSSANHKRAWRLAGRMFHVLQDMTSPLHVFSVSHVLNSCHFEVYWDAFFTEALEAVTSRNTQPVLPFDLAPTSTARLDAFTRAALEARIFNTPDTLMGYMDALAWSAYYRSSFWGEICYAEGPVDAQTTATLFDDGEVETLPNTFNMMFDGSIRYHTAWWGDYFDLTDRMGNTFAWNRLAALDEWRPCPNPRGRHVVDGHSVSNGADGLHITGRFLFTHRGKKTPYCYPVVHPDGTAMEAHLLQYYGETLFPVMVAYGSGWFGALAERFPKMFTGAADKLSAPTKKGEGRLAFWEMLSAFLGEEFPENGSSVAGRGVRESDSPEYVYSPLPRCGCVESPIFTLPFCL
ncbi:MAG TPA: hypothetical protein ENN29_10125 [Candidatus Hydrogenedentes bacterium]|nr:hypothetical protein [Candidatus Hydrogenedentota bacterium]